MFTRESIEELNELNSLPKDIIVNTGLCFDPFLFDALSSETIENDYKTYDFDVFLPTYGINLQRPYVWEWYQQNNFITDLLLEKPILPFVVVEFRDNAQRDNDKAIIKVIDGKQRILTLYKFLHNEFPINCNGKTIYYKDFDASAIRFLKTRINFLTANVYYSFINDKRLSEISDRELIMLFNYYNFSGVPQAEEHKRRLQNLLGE